MENTKLATLVASSMLTVLAVSGESTKIEYIDLNAFESSLSQIDLRTCNQCNIPQPSHGNKDA